MYKYSKKIFFIPLILVGAYMLGPAPTPPRLETNIPVIPTKGNELEAYVRQQEKRHKLKPGNEARIVWFDKAKKQKTPYSVVYLHGFSASHEEGAPVHTGFAKKFGCNLYLSRLADHGIDTVDQLLYFTADRLWNSAQQALAIGKAIGEKVILMSTSTGGTMALLLAANYPKDVYALINMSPNIAINDQFACILNNPWGLQIARLVMGGKYIEKKQQSPEEKKYWYTKYRLEATTQLEELLEQTMNESTFKRVQQPGLTLYYYQDEDHQDPVVKVNAILKMHALLGTNDLLKVAVPIPHAGTHVIGSGLKSKDVETVSEEIEKFAIEKLGMHPLDTSLFFPHRRSLHEPSRKAYQSQQNHGKF